MGPPSRDHPDARGWTAPVVLLLSGLTGGVTGALLAHLSTRGGLLVHPSLSALPMIMGAAGWAAGVLVGWLVAALVLTRAHGQLSCPRCGTANPQGSSTCRACDLTIG